MNEELLELSKIVSNLEDENIMSVLFMDIAREFDQKQNLTLQEVINKLKEIN